MPSDEELINAVQEAFRGVKLEDGVSLNMTEYLDSYETQERFKELAANDERDDWQKIDDQTLEAFTVVFCFTDWNGFRFYLPAYMIWTIKHPDSGSIIGDNTVWTLDPDAISHHCGRKIGEIFDERQTETIVQFLQHCVDDPDHCDDLAAARRLARWRRHIDSRARMPPKTTPPP
jgi:hypothetical protein